MLKKCTLFSLLSLVLLASLVGADDAPKSDAAKAKQRERIEKYLATASPGVFFSEEEDTKDGRIIRLYLVGTSTISTVLGASEGVEIAQEKTEEAAKAAFLKFLESKVTIRKTVTNEIILMKEGQENASGEGNTKETGKQVERRTKEYQETAQGIVRGIKAAGHEIKDKSFVAVYKWEAKTAEQAKDIKDGKGPDKKEETKSPPASDPSKKIIPKKVIIDD